MNVYYRFWLDGLQWLWHSPPDIGTTRQEAFESRKWVMLIAGSMAMIYWLFILGFYFIDITGSMPEIELDLTSSTVVNEVLTGLVYPFLPVFGINYWLVFRRNKYERYWKPGTKDEPRTPGKLFWSFVVGSAVTVILFVFSLIE